MIGNNFILREPLLDPKQKVIGFEFSWQQKDGQGESDSEELNYLLGFVAGHLNDEDKGYLLGDSMIFIEAAPDLLQAESLEQFPAEKTVLILHKRHFAEQTTLDRVKALRSRGFGICLRGAEVTTLERSFFAHVSHIEVKLNAANFASQAKVYAALKQSSVKMVARNVSTWQDFDACSALGLDSFVGKLHLTPRQTNAPKALNPSQTTILQLMEMVRKNADVQQLESVVKRDVVVVE